MTRSTRIVCMILWLCGAGTALAEVLLPDGARGEGIARGEPLDVITDAWRAEVESDLRARIARMESDGTLAPPTKAAGTLFMWPARLVPGHPDPSGWFIANFVDQNAAFPNQVRDWNCGARTYDDASGYNHRGTDISSYPFRWLKMDNDEYVVVAAAAGTIVRKDDGNFDRNCDRLNPQSSPNAIFVRHADGSLAWYLHFKSQSLTTKAIGDSVAAGEFLGVAGSSGSSTAPHLHFEVYDASGKLVDPYAGTCNLKNADSWWAQQPPYWDPGVLRMTVGTAAAATNTCPAAESPNLTNYIALPGTAYFTVYLRDFLLGASAILQVLRPNGTVFATRTLANSQQDYPASYWYYTFTMPAGEMAGTWTFRVDFAGATHTIPFTVGIAEPPRTTVTEFYHAGFGHYFVTGTAAEAAALDQGRPSGWARTGRTFPAYAAGAAGQGPVCRFFWTPPPNTPSTHFYTVIASECALVKGKPDWTFEENAYASIEPSATGVCPANTRPLYRLYNDGQRNSPNHRYTTSFTVVVSMQSQGWLLEGVVMCLPQ